MDIKIKRLTPDMAEDYLHFFDTTPHDDSSDENKCYCVCWCSADHRTESNLSSSQKRRELAKQYVKDGVLQGYAAYCGDRMVGWCNSNVKTDCIYCSSWLRFMQEVEIDVSKKVKSVFCFTIAPDMRKQGVATMLLESVCTDAKAQGFDYIEAYPRKNTDGTKQFSNFQGPYRMFEKAGFIEHKELSDKVIMRKYLK